MCRMARTPHGSGKWPISAWRLRGDGMKKHRPRPAPRRKPVRTPGPPPPRRPAWDATPFTFEPDLLYDAIEGPNPREWMELDESERLSLVELYHDHLDIELPSPPAH